MAKYCPMCDAVTNCTDNCSSCMAEEMTNKPKIVISKSVHNTVDVVVYELPSTKMVDFFMLLDIWGSKGYDRFNDNGLYFEVPTFVYDAIEEIPFVKTNRIEVVKR